ncbi:hypothetical protein HIM_07185 [Hirsutella minnesotensis 3608]|uniref:Uncharacterized protein n=1 Tax=Hirsutella minnesotensis 3608 TaxID=1043627 RepID=A0A0F7ZI37_9HYPO|nr:hypothetical protein HIM_07185 [Hirsutella minnesotensis 3608]
MDSFKGIVKKGWHPEKEGTTLRGQVSGLMGRSKDSSYDRSNHASRPLNELKDPSSFAPPPRRSGNAPLPPPSRPRDPHASEPLHGEQSQPSAGEAPSRGPYQVNTTGLRADHLQPPPGRRDGADGRNPPAYNASATTTTTTTRPAPETKNSAGGFSSQVSELQNRFSSMRTSSSAAAPPSAPSQGTTWEQKQSALKTASAFHKDPSKVSLSDAKAAAGTANNFRQRHGEQVQAGYKRANDLNQKYGIMDKVGSYAGRFKDQTASTSEADAQAQAAKKKPPPPPPPKKKPGIGGAGEAQGADGADPDVPPPIPMSTRPNF